MANKVHVKKGDTVLVLSGKDRGKKGKILEVIPSKMKVLVEGINMVMKHKKAKAANQQGGIIKQEAAIYSAKVMIICDKCGSPTKISKIILDNGDKARKCKKCDEMFGVVKYSKKD